MLEHVQTSEVNCNDTKYTDILYIFVHPVWRTTTYGCDGQVSTNFGKIYVKITFKLKNEHQNDRSTSPPVLFPLLGELSSASP